MGRTAPYPQGTGFLLFFQDEDFTPPTTEGFEYSGEDMTDLADQVYTATTTETLNMSVSFADKLSTGELLTGTPTVTEETTSDLTITNKAVSTAILTIDGKSVAAGAAVQYSASGFQHGITYRIDSLCNSDSIPAQVLNRESRVIGKAT